MSGTGEVNKIFAVYLALENNRPMGGVVAKDYETAFALACKLLNKKPEEINLVDTGRTKATCCGGNK